MGKFCLQTWAEAKSKHYFGVWNKRSTDPLQLVFDSTLSLQPARRPWQKLWISLLSSEYCLRDNPMDRINPGHVTHTRKRLASTFSWKIFIHPSSRWTTAGAENILRTFLERTNKISTARTTNTIGGGTHFSWKRCLLKNIGDKNRHGSKHMTARNLKGHSNWNMCVQTCIFLCCNEVLLFLSEYDVGIEK